MIYTPRIYNLYHNRETFHKYQKRIPEESMNTTDNAFTLAQTLTYPK